MGDLSSDLALSGEGVLWESVIPAAWDFELPNGGILAALCMRAASNALPGRLPLSISSTFLRPARSGMPAQISVEPLKSGARAGAVAVDLTQSGHRVMRSTIWMRGASPTLGLAHDHATMPPFPPPRDVPVVPNTPRGRKSYPFYQNVEERRLPTEGDDGEPEWIGWYRFLPKASYGDAAIDRARSVVLLDALALPSAVVRHPKHVALATTTQTDVMFCSLPEADDTEWLLVRVVSPQSHSGMLWAHGMVWSQSGRLLAQGQSQMVYMSDAVER